MHPKLAEGFPNEVTALVDAESHEEFPIAELREVRIERSEVRKDSLPEHDGGGFAHKVLIEFGLDGEGLKFTCGNRPRVFSDRIKLFDARTEVASQDRIYSVFDNEPPQAEGKAFRFRHPCDQLFNAGWIQAVVLEEEFNVLSSGQLHATVPVANQAKVLLIYQDSTIGMIGKKSPGELDRGVSGAIVYQQNLDVGIALRQGRLDGFS